MDRSPLPAEACPFVGHAYRQLGRYDDAVHAFERCAAADPLNAELAFFVGLGNEWSTKFEPPRSGTGGPWTCRRPTTTAASAWPASTHRTASTRRSRRRARCWQRAAARRLLLVAGLAEQRAGHGPEARIPRAGRELAADYFDVQLALGMLDYSDRGTARPTTASRRRCARCDPSR